MVMDNVFYFTVLTLLSMLSTWWVFKYILKIAKLKNIVDNPNERKLQRVPVPVLGGMAIFFGMIVSLVCAGLIFDTVNLYVVMGIMCIMLYVGTVDDILSLSWYTRIFMQTIIIAALIYCNHYSLNDFHGLWGVFTIPDYLSVPLTLFACVGIINSINLMDGVNGLSSGYCILVCAIFAGIFIYTGNVQGAALAVISMGALIPFFFHNVFGEKSKMFIGDGGTLLMGTVISTFIIEAVSGKSDFYSHVPENFGVIPFALALLSIPVFDTLRVMIMRIIRGKSPFSPDKTHLHHLFIDLGFSHIAVTISEIMMNIVVILVWLGCYMAGLSINCQFYAVTILSILVTFGFYKYMRVQIARESGLYRVMRRAGEWSRSIDSAFGRHFRKFLDHNCD